MSWGAFYLRGSAFSLLLHLHPTWMPPLRRRNERKYKRTHSDSVKFALYSGIREGPHTALQPSGGGEHGIMELGPYPEAYPAANMQMRSV